MKPPISYPPGFFTALCRLHDWPPGYWGGKTAEQLEQDRRDAGEKRRIEAAQRGRLAQKRKTEPA